MTTEFHRRQYVRANVDIPVEFSVERDVRREQGVAVDLGAGGMRLRTPIDLHAGSDIEMRFRLGRNGDREIVARGRVVLSFFNRNQQTYQHGIAFTAVSREDRIAIDEFVRAQEVGKGA